MLSECFLRNGGENIKIGYLIPSRYLGSGQLSQDWLFLRAAYPGKDPSFEATSNLLSAETFLHLPR